MKLNLLCALTLSRTFRSFDIVGGRYIRIMCHISDLGDASWQSDRRRFGILSLLISSCLTRRNNIFRLGRYHYYFKASSKIYLCKKVPKNILLSVLNNGNIKYERYIMKNWIHTYFMHMISCKEKRSFRGFNL